MDVLCDITSLSCCSLNKGLCHALSLRIHQRVIARQAHSLSTSTLQFRNWEAGMKNVPKSTKVKLNRDLLFECMYGLFFIHCKISTGENIFCFVFRLKSFWLSWCSANTELRCICRTLWRSSNLNFPKIIRSNLMRYSFLYIHNICM